MWLKSREVVKLTGPIANDSTDPKNIEYLWTHLMPHVWHLFYSTLLLAIHDMTDWSSKIKRACYFLELVSAAIYVVCPTTSAELIFHAYQLDGLAAETLNICLHERKRRDCWILAKADKFTLSRFEGNRICETARGPRGKEKEHLLHDEHEQAQNQQEQTGWKHRSYSDLWSNTITVIYARLPGLGYTWVTKLF